MNSRESNVTKRETEKECSTAATTCLLKVAENGDGSTTLDVEWNEGYVKFAASVLGRRKLSADEVARFFGASLMACRKQADGTIKAESSEICARFAELTQAASKAKITKAKKPEAQRAKDADELV